MKRFDILKADGTADVVEGDQAYVGVGVGDLVVIRLTEDEDGSEVVMAYAPGWWLQMRELGPLEEPRLGVPTRVDRTGKRVL